MTVLQAVFAGASFASTALALNASAGSTTPFASTFHQPTPPFVQAAYKASWNQHKWDANVSHISCGYMYSSVAAKKVRVDEAYDGALGSSLFDYSNVTTDGVSNAVWLLSPSLTSPPQIFTGYVVPAFPLVEADFLITSNAVYAGSVTDPYAGEVTKWNLLYAGELPTTILLDDHNVIRGYDYWSSDRRTYATTRLFNIVVGESAEDTFDFPTSV